MRRLFGCPDIVSLTDIFLMARNVLRIFTENNPARGIGKKYNMPEVKGLRKIMMVRYMLKKGSKVTWSQLAQQS